MPRRMASTLYVLSVVMPGKLDVKFIWGRKKRMQGFDFIGISNYARVLKYIWAKQLSMPNTRWTNAQFYNKFKYNDEYKLYLSMDVMSSSERKEFLI